MHLEEAVCDFCLYRKSRFFVRNYFPLGINNYFNLDLLARKKQEGAGGLCCLVSSETGGNQEGLAYPIANFLSSRSYPTRIHWLKLYYSYYFKNKNVILILLYVHLEAYIVLKAYFQICLSIVFARGHGL